MKSVRAFGALFFGVVVMSMLACTPALVVEPEKQPVPTPTPMTQEQVFATPTVIAPTPTPLPRPQGARTRSRRVARTVVPLAQPTVAIENVRIDHSSQVVETETSQSPVLPGLVEQATSEETEPWWTPTPIAVVAGTPAAPVSRPRGSQWGWWLLVLVVVVILLMVYWRASVETKRQQSDQASRTPFHSKPDQSATRHQDHPVSFHPRTQERPVQAPDLEEDQSEKGSLPMESDFPPHSMEDHTANQPVPVPEIELEEEDRTPVQPVAKEEKPERGERVEFKEELPLTPTSIQPQPVTPPQAIAPIRRSRKNTVKKVTSVRKAKKVSAQTVLSSPTRGLKKAVTKPVQPAVKPKRVVKKTSQHKKVTQSKKAVQSKKVLQPKKAAQAKKAVQPKKAIQSKNAAKSSAVGAEIIPFRRRKIG